MAKIHSKKQTRYRQSAFLFNPKDWITDTMFFNRIEKGIYIDLLSLQWINKVIPSDLNRLYGAIGNQLPFDDEAILLGLQGGYEKDILKSHLGQLGFCSFTTAMKTLMVKFKDIGNGYMINERLEEERAAAAQYDEYKTDRAVKANEARWGKIQEGIQSGVQEGIQSGVQEGVQEAIQNSILKHPNSNSNSNILLENKKNVREDERPLGDLLKSKKSDQQPPAPREFSIQRHQNSPLRVFLPRVEESFAKAIEGAFLGHGDSFLSAQNVFGKPDDFIVYILQQFLFEKSLMPGDISSGKLVREYIFWLNANFNRIEREYNNQGKDLDWFNNELKELNGKSGLLRDPDVVKKFTSYYTTKKESGRMHFQTMANFNMKDALESWIKKEASGKSKNNMTHAPGEVVVPHGDMSPEEQEEFYKRT